MLLLLLRIGFFFFFPSTVKKKKKKQMDDDQLEQTLFVCRDNVKVFQIPPRTSDRVLSAEWRVDACCFTGRLRLLAKGDHAEIRLEDANT